MQTNHSPKPVSKAAVLRRFKTSRSSLRKGLPSLSDRIAAGRALRKKTPRSSHAEWSPAPRRPDPVELLLETDRGRVKQLLPIRHGRMAASPFALLRGSAAQMAADLARTPTTGLEAWLCGDAHLSNFGIYASPERKLVIDINDFDESTVGPWEWDLKRLAASIEIAGRDRGFGRKHRRRAVTIAVSSYRELIARLAKLPLLELYSLRLDEERLQKTRLWADASKAERRRARKTLGKAEQRTNDQALRKFAKAGPDGDWEFLHKPPLLERVDRETAAGLTSALEQYAAETLPPDRVAMLRSYVVSDVVFKVVGVGSVGTRAYVAMLIGNDADDALFLQIKEAGDSALTPHLKKAPALKGAERVVGGQRRLQSVSDPFLGWTKFGKRSYYVRQLRDMKGSADIETMPVGNFAMYARLCGGILAKCHARTGDAAAIAGYCGGGDVLDRALYEFASRYSDQVESDHAAVVEAIADGRIKAESGV